MDAHDDPDRVYRVRLEVPAADAWHAVTDPDSTRAFYFDTAIRTEWVVGGPLEYVADDGTVQITGELISLVEGRSFAHRFIAMWSGEPDDQGVLEWIVDPDGDESSTVTLIQTGGSGTETDEGNRRLLERLRAVVE